MPLEIGHDPLVVGGPITSSPVLGLAFVLVGVNDGGATRKLQMVLLFILLVLVPKHPLLWCAAKVWWRMRISISVMGWFVDSLVFDLPFWIFMVGF